VYRDPSCLSISCSGYLRPYLIFQNNSATLLACLIDFLQTVVRPTGADWKILHVLDEVLRIAIHLITILQFMQTQMTEPVKIFIDNKSATR